MPAARPAGVLHSCLLDGRAATAGPAWQPRTLSRSASSALALAVLPSGPWLPLLVPSPGVLVPADPPHHRGAQTPNPESRRRTSGHPQGPCLRTVRQVPPGRSAATSRRGAKSKLTRQLGVGMLSCQPQNQRRNAVRGEKLGNTGCPSPAGEGGGPEGRPAALRARARHLLGCPSATCRERARGPLGCPSLLPLPQPPGRPEAKAAASEKPSGAAPPGGGGAPGWVSTSQLGAAREARSERPSVSPARTSGAEARAGPGRRRRGNGARGWGGVGARSMRGAAGGRDGPCPPRRAPWGFWPGSLRTPGHFRFQSGLLRGLRVTVVRPPTALPQGDRGGAVLAAHLPRLKLWGFTLRPSIRPSIHLGPTGSLRGSQHQVTQPWHPNKGPAHLSQEGKD